MRAVLPTAVSPRPVTALPALAAPNAAPAASLSAAPPFAPSLAVVPAPAAAPAPALTVLEAARPALDAAPAALFTAGRMTFDASLAAPAEADAPALPLAAAAPLDAPVPLLTRAALAVPFAAPLAAADGGTGLLVPVLLGLAFLAVLTRVLAARRPAPPPPTLMPEMPPAETDLASLRTQTLALVDSVREASRRERRLDRAIGAMRDAWYRAERGRGLGVWDPREERWTLTPIAPELFAAIDLPDILDRIARRGDARALGDLLEGLAVEPGRAQTPVQLYERLAWWKEHFRRFYP